MDKENLILEIEKIPKFVLRDVATKETTIGGEGESINLGWLEQENFRAVTEENGLYPLAFVTKRYNLIQFKEVFNSRR